MPKLHDPLARLAIRYDWDVCHKRASAEWICTRSVVFQAAVSGKEVENFLMKLIALLTCILGLLLVAPLFRLLTRISKRRNRLTANDVADTIERHIEGTEGPFDWDSFTSIPIADEGLDAIRMRCVELDHPTPVSAENLKELKRIAEQLKSHSN